ncbi:9316_t:CDS:1, partial [Scutellospora calospora]
KSTTVNKSTKTCDIILILPTELTHEIFGSLPLASICNASVVSRRWRHFIINSKSLWQNLDFTFLRKSNMITDKVVSTYVNRGKLRIHSFICHNAVKLTDKTLNAFRAVPCYHLSTFILTSNRLITDTAIIIFIRTIGSQLRIINLSDTLISNRA